MKSVAAALILALSLSHSFAQMSINVPHKYDIGTISTDSLSKNPIGTGFLVGKNFVFTCEHAVDGLSTFYYLPYESKRSFRIAVRKTDTLHDLAVLICDDIICNRYISISPSFDPKIGDSLFYIGYDTKIDGFYVQLGRVQEVGHEKSQSSQVDYFNFNGKIRHGYSGGPVFDRSGEIIGIIKAARFIGSDVSEYARAYSPIPLREFIATETK